MSLLWFNNKAVWLVYNIKCDTPRKITTELTSSISTLLTKAIVLRHAQDNTSRPHLFDDQHENAFRMFNRFYKGYPEIGYI